MANWFSRRKPTVSNVVRRNIKSIAELEEEVERQRTLVDRISDEVTAFAGSIRFIIAHAIFYGGWFLLNVTLPEGWRFDPYPFPFLNLTLAVEAIFLSTLVLMSQNRQNRIADQWAQVDLQVSLLAEQESTKMLEMLKRISDKLGLKNEVKEDRELKELVEKTHVETLVEELEKAREKEEAGKKPE